MGRKVENFRNKQGFIELNKLKRFKESGVVVEGSNAKCWFNVSGERFLFKEYDDILSVFGEVLYYRAAQICDIDCAQYDFAILDDKKGTISFDFLKENETYYNFLELSSEFGENNLDLTDISTNRELLIIQNNKYNNLSAIKSLLARLFRIPLEQRKEIEQGLVKMFVLDTLLWHQDRTIWNYGIVINEENDDVRLAQVHDNSHVLCLHKGEDYIKECVMEFINNGVMSSSKYGFNKFDSLTDEDDSIDQLVDFYCCSNEETRKKINDIVEHFEVEEIIEELEKKCQISEVTSLWVRAVLNFRRKTILRGIESAKINDEEAKMPSIAFSKRK